MLTDKKVIFFDMGNTLLHFHYGKSDDEKDFIGLGYLTTYLKKFDSRITLQAVKKDFYDVWNEALCLRKVKLTEYPIESYLNSFMNKYDLNLNHSQCIEAIDVFYSDYKNHVQTESGLYETLKKIKSKGYKIGVISNSCRYDEVMVNCFKAAKIDALIDSYTFSYYLRICKPKKGIFEKALEKMDVCPKDAVMIGDSLESDIKPALDLGLKTVWLNKDSKTNDTCIKPDIEISSISDLYKYV